MILLRFCFRAFVPVVWVFAYRPLWFSGGSHSSHLRKLVRPSPPIVEIVRILLSCTLFALSSQWHYVALQVESTEMTRAYAQIRALSGNS